MTSRREFLATAAGASLAAVFPARLRAQSNRDAALSIWILRGGLDGLAALVPWADPDYEQLRGALAIAPPGRAGGGLDLNGEFALHPVLANMHALYLAGELLPVHAVATPYRERSHFDGQKILENGTMSPGATTGWLNRALQVDADWRAVAIAPGVPLILRGKPEQVTAWSPSSLPDADPDTLDRVRDLYAYDDFFAERFELALQARDMMDGGADTMRGQRRGAITQWTGLAGAAGRFMREPDGPVVTVMELNGWDTHANQGAASGQLAARLTGLDTALAEFRRTCGERWASTCVMVVTEFGRTAAPNGTNGTDHGTAAAAFLAGGAVNGGRVLSDWPGLSRTSLYASRDVQPTLDLRALLKGVLSDHLSILEPALSNEVFPGSANITAQRDLFA